MHDICSSIKQIFTVIPVQVQRHHLIGIMVLTFVFLFNWVGEEIEKQSRYGPGEKDIPSNYDSLPLN